MPISFTYIFQSVVSLVEMLLIYYLHSKRLKLRPQKWFVRFCFLSEYLILLFLGFTIVNFTLRLFLTFIVYIVTAFTVSTSDFLSNLFWGSIYGVIIVLADSIAFLSGSLLTGLPAAQLLFSAHSSSLLSLVYLLACFCCVYFLAHWDSGLVVFPRYVPFIYLGLVFLGSSMVELLLDLLLQMNEKDHLTEWIIYSAIGIIFLSLFLILLLLHRVGRLYQKNVELTEQTRQQQFEKQQYELICNTNQFLRGWKHDQRQFLSSLKILLENGNYQEGIKLVDSMDESLCVGNWKVQTGNTAIDAVLSMKLSAMEENSIHFTHTIFLPEHLPLTNLEWSSLLGNLMDNAIRACQEMKEASSRYIELEIKPQQQFLSVRIKNSSDGKYHFGSAGQLLSTKSEAGHGIGLKRVEQIVTQAGGFFHVDAADDCFEVTIALNLRRDLPGSESSQERALSPKSYAKG